MDKGEGGEIAPYGTLCVVLQLQLVMVPTRRQRSLVLGDFQFEHVRIDYTFYKFTVVSYAHLDGFVVLCARIAAQTERIATRRQFILHLVNASTVQYIVSKTRSSTPHRITL